MSQTANPTADVLTVEETARYLRLSRGSTYAAIKRGDIPTVRIGRRILIPKAALVALLERSAN